MEPLLRISDRACLSMIGEVSWDPKEDERGPFNITRTSSMGITGYNCHYLVLILYIFFQERSHGNGEWRGTGWRTFQSFQQQVCSGTFCTVNHLEYEFLGITTMKPLLLATTLACRIAFNQQGKANYCEYMLFWFFLPLRYAPCN